MIPYNYPIPTNNAINWGNPLSRELVISYPCNEGGLTLYNRAIWTTQTGTLTNGPYYKDNSLYFDGTDDYCQITAPFGTGTTTAQNYTVSFWFKTKDLNDSTLFSYASAAGTNNQYWRFMIRNATSNLVCQVGGSGGFTTLTIGTTAGPTTITTERWYHVVMTRNRTTSTTNIISLYINGILTHTRSVNFGANITVTDPCVIGAAYDFTANANIYIRDINIWNRELSQAEVKDLYLRPYQIYNIRNSRTYMEVISAFKSKFWYFFD